VNQAEESNLELGKKQLAIANPFQYGVPVPPSHFVGREREVRMIFDLITGSARGSVAVSGERLIGKTSLLRYVAAPEIAKAWGGTPDRYIFLYLNCQSISQFTPTRFWRTVLDLLSRHFSAGELQEMIEGLRGQKEIRAADLEVILDEIHDRGQALVLLLDEFEWVIRTDTAQDIAITLDFLSGLRALVTHSKRVFSLITATREPVHQLCAPIKFIGSPFYVFFANISLKPFTREEAEELIDKALKGTGIEFSKADRDFVFEVSGGHPHWLQNACFKLFEKKLQLVGERPDYKEISSTLKEEKKVITIQLPPLQLRVRTVTSISITLTVVAGLISLITSNPAAIAVTAILAFISLGLFAYELRF